MATTPCTYLLPIRRKAFNETDANELRTYFGAIRDSLTEVIVLDGSPSDVFAAHDDLWSEICRHEQVDRHFGFKNDKVNGIYTGLHLATTELIVLADDDIRYSSDNIHEIVALLDRFDVVRPQNFLAMDRGIGRWPMGHHPSADAPHVDCNFIAGDHRRAADAKKEVHGQDAHATNWWAKMEAARMLINRATLRTADYPGTCAFRRELLLRGEKYDGDVLFDNEELIRHFARRGAKICYANDLLIRKRPPALRKWLEQRPRQAYEDFGLRTKTVLFASLPLVLLGCGIWLGLKSTVLIAVAMGVLSMGLALLGRSRGTARNFFPLHVCLFAPLWVFERSLSTYWAFYWFLSRGGYPFGEALLQKGIGRDWVEGGRIAARSISKR